MCGFNLTKFVAMNDEILKDVQEEKKSVSLKAMAIENVHFERALGLIWNMENGTLGFRVVLKDTPLTRRGVLYPQLDF